MASLATDSQDDRNTRFHGCSSINQYEVLEKLGEGTFGCVTVRAGKRMYFRFIELTQGMAHREVHKAKSHKTGALVALKKILMHNEKDGVCLVVTLSAIGAQAHSRCSSPSQHFERLSC